MGRRLEDGDRVTWTTPTGYHGSGVILMEEGTGPHEGHVIVAKDAPEGEERGVIYCASTWLTPVGTDAVAP